MTFVPFDATEDEVAARQVLRPGVPRSMRAPLLTWIVRGMARDYGTVDMSVFHDMENNLDFSFGLPPTVSGALDMAYARTLLNELNDQVLLRVVDYRLSKVSGFEGSDVTLQEILQQGRSQYGVVQRDHSFRLSLVLPEGVQSATEQVIAESGVAGRLLGEAWEKLYDLTPDDSAAYALAVKAVEAAALPALGISKATASVSDAIRKIEASGASWMLPFKREHTQYPSREVLLAMLKSLYRGQRDRHGSADYSAVTHEEAEAATLMAVTLVGLFARDLVQERDPEAYG